MNKSLKGSDIFIFDIETTNLDANRGHVLCWAGKWAGEREILSGRIDDTKGYGKTPQSWEWDLAMLRPLVENIEMARAVVAYYGGYMKFDVPYVNTRLMRWGADPLKQLTVVDPFQSAKSKLKLARNNLDSVATLLGCKHKKYHLPWEDWNKAKFGDRAAMDKLLKYCKNDVKTLEDVYVAMLPLFPSHPLTAPGGLSNSDKCRVCGGATYSKGWRYRAKTKVHDVVCRSCGWRGDGRVERL